MRKPWWRSIRWRLALGSVLVALLATFLLAFTVIVMIRYYYRAEQQTGLHTVARDRALSIGIDYAQSSTLTRAARNVMVAGANKEELATTQHLYLVVEPKNGRLVFPLNAPKGSAYSIVRSLLTDASFKNSDQLAVSKAIKLAISNKKTTVGTFGRANLVDNALPFIVAPIYYGGQTDGEVVGVLIVTPFSTNIPPFVSTLGYAVIFASVVIAVIAAAVAILFARTITRPLVRLSHASRGLAAGDYDTRVATNAPGELGELAQTFNEMAALLKRDVEELRRQESWRRELIMNITHDLATPLTAIAGLGEALVDGVSQSQEEQEATGRIIVRETLRLRRLVQDLHVMAKVEAGALQPERKPVRLASLVDDVLAMLIAEFERHEIEPDNRIPYALPPVLADADMLNRVLANLCSNALRHTPRGGSIIFAAHIQEGMLLVSISDTGEGIPEEAIGRIFERFYRGDNARQAQTGGSGLGLAIVRAIIEAHGGRVWAENAPQRGARILFTLPLHMDNPLDQTQMQRLA